LHKPFALTMTILKMVVEIRKTVYANVCNETMIHAVLSKSILSKFNCVFHALMLHFTCHGTKKRIHWSDFHVVLYRK